MERHTEGRCHYAVRTMKLDILDVSDVLYYTVIKSLGAQNYQFGGKHLFGVIIQ